MRQAFAREIIKLAPKIRRQKVNMVEGPSNKWYRGLLKRTPDLSMRTVDTLDRGRYGMTNKTVMKQHFECLDSVLNNLGNNIK